MMRSLRALVGALLVCRGSPPAARPSLPLRGPAAADAARGGVPLTVKHAMGETLIPAQPKRVVALDQSFVDAVLTLETPVVGYTSYRSIDEKLPEYLGTVATEYGKEATTVGTLEQPSLEKIWRSSRT